jgi:hypothetical protein
MKLGRFAHIPLVLAALAPLLGGCFVREGPPVYYHHTYYRPVRYRARHVRVGANTPAATPDHGQTQTD